MRSLRQIADIRELLLGEPRRSHLGCCQLKDGFGCDDSAGSRNQSVENCARSASMKLLENDGAHQRFKARIAILHAVRANAINDRAKNRVRLLEMVKSASHEIQVGGG